jgi:RNA polymerase sigma-70 factor (ECF subfamily)
MADPHQFEAFVRRYQDMVFATALRLLGSPAEAEDVAQTVFLRAFQRFDAVGTDPAVGGWLKTVTRNACLNHLARYRARWQLFSQMGPAEAEDDYAAQVPGQGTPLQALEAAEELERLEQAIAQLPDHQRVPLVLFHFEDMSYQQIADTLQVSLGKVKTDIHRGREALRTLLRTDDD